MRSDWLDAFLVFSECLNFTHAAEKLHISQPALHVKINKFAEHVGKPLYSKSGRHLALTPEGQRIQAFAREMHERSSRFLASLRGVATDQAIMLAAGEGVYLYLLGPALQHLGKTSSQPFRLLNANSVQAIEALRTGRAHLSISVLTSVADDITSTPLTHVNQVLVMPKTHRLAKKKMVSLKDLDNESLILPSVGRPHRIAIEQALLNQSIQWKLAVEANGWELMVHFVKLGIGLAIVNSCVHIPASLVAKPLAELPTLAYHIFERKEGWENPALDKVKNILLQYRDKWKA